VLCPKCQEMGLNFSFLRVIRALRPLRTLQSIPALRYLIEMLLCSVLSVSYTLVFLMFVFVVWSIMAVQMWGWDGRTHGRCRLTPFPVTLEHFEWPIDDVALAAAYYDNTSAVTRCSTDWNVGDKWTSPQDCAWPMVQTGVVRLCGLSPSDLPDGAVIVEGARQCSSRIGLEQWCGSNFDIYGNARFQSRQVRRLNKQQYHSIDKQQHRARTHTHTHSLSLSPPSLFLTLSLSLSLSLSPLFHSLLDRWCSSCR
jgi:hypothetical protein